MRTILALLMAAFPAALLAEDGGLSGRGPDVNACNDDSITINVTASPTRTTPGGAINLSWDGTSASGWNVTDRGSVTGNSTSVTAPSMVGNKTYTVSGTGACGGEVSGSVTIEVYQPRRVYLSGSRYSDGPTVRDYMNWTAGSEVQSLVNSQASAEDRARLSTFFSGMASWPSSADVYQRPHEGGVTYIVDERGEILGTMSTPDLWANGLPGMSYLGNPWGNGDYNKVFVGNGALNYGGVDYEVIGLVSVSPIVLDLDGNDLPDVDRGEWLPHPTRFNRARSVLFDINADGFPDITEWIGPKDGLLVAPLKRAQGVKGENLFGNPIGFFDGYQKLGLKFDSNQDGAIAGTELDGLLVWQDVNSNGKAEAAELRGASELGISSISTQHKSLKSSYTINGKERATWDWWPTCMLVYPKPVVKAPAGAAPKL
ncbi:MAG: hypothetical protein HY553_00755 [Elusimicrobia bacterium]|nr:hypothetical protein [Elusimicrobiota bacterium]